MKIGERLLLIFNMLVAVGAFVLLGIAVWQPYIMLMLLDLAVSSVYIQISLTALLALLAILSIRSIFSGLKGKNGIATLAATTGEGGIYINVDTVNELAFKAAKKNEQVRDARVRTVMEKDGANIYVKLSLLPETVIPQASANVQQNVKADIQDLCGIPVKKVAVQVDNSLQTQK